MKGKQKKKKKKPRQFAEFKNIGSLFIYLFTFSPHQHYI